MISFKVDVTAIINNSYATASLIELKLIQRKKEPNKKKWRWVDLLCFKIKNAQICLFFKSEHKPRMKNLEEQRNKLLLKILFVLEAEFCLSSETCSFFFFFSLKSDSEVIQHFNFV